MIRETTIKRHKELALKILKTGSASFGFSEFKKALKIAEKQGLDIKEGDIPVKVVHSIVDDVRYAMVLLDSKVKEDAYFVIFRVVPESKYGVRFFKEKFKCIVAM